MTNSSKPQRTRVTLIMKVGPDSTSLEKDVGLTGWGVVLTPEASTHPAFVYALRRILRENTCKVLEVTIREIE